MKILFSREFQRGPISYVEILRFKSTREFGFNIGRYGFTVNFWAWKVTVSFA